MVDSPPPFEYDEEARNLQLEAEKAKYRLAIAEARRALDAATKPAAAETTEIPSVAGAPTGAVTVGEGAGTFGAWLAQCSLDACADEIRDQVLKHVSGGRVLVVEGRTVAGGSFAAHWVAEEIERVDTQLTHAGNAVDQILQADKAFPGAPTAGAPTPRLPEGTDAEFAVEESTPGGGSLSTAATGLSTALGLLGWVGADYSITASSVTISTARLAVLTTGSLAAKGVGVELSDFGQLAATSPVVTRAVEATRRLDAIGHGLARAEAVVAPRRTPVTRLRATVTLLEDAWKVALAGKPEEAAARLNEVKPELTAARVELAAAEDAAAPLETRLAAATESLTTAARILAALSTPGTDGTVPLRTAVLYEGLTGEAGDLSITHVLLVQADAAGADTVTRRVLLGESGRVSFLGGVNNSWVLLDVDTHTVVAGGPASTAQRMVFDLGSGESSVHPVKFGDLSSDPFEKLVTWSRYLVVALCVFLVLFAAAQVIDPFV